MSKQAATAKLSGSLTVYSRVGVRVLHSIPKK